MGACVRACVSELVTLWDQPDDEFVAVERVDSFSVLLQRVHVICVLACVHVYVHVYGYIESPHL